MKSKHESTDGATPLHDQLAREGAAAWRNERDTLHRQLLERQFHPIPPKSPTIAAAESPWPDTQPSARELAALDPADCPPTSWYVLALETRGRLTGLMVRLLGIAPSTGAARRAWLRSCSSLVLDVAAGRPVPTGLDRAAATFFEAFRQTDPAERAAWSATRADVREHLGSATGVLDALSQRLDRPGDRDVLKTIRARITEALTGLRDRIRASEDAQAQTRQRREVLAAQRAKADETAGGRS